ncbi:Glycosyl transferase, family II [Desulfonema limicola]|uniref:Glycosyl transferase, family II n=1 Tax=Desulfonema limicola TaxID=45656 RepID=A0A975GFW0_9BACT|nr:glycosyltransferase family 2 protein [Desulfonema limicola]QTA79589.1 Glycosyl transferase, family II [Desulfonema limicola]
MLYKSSFAIVIPVYNHEQMIRDVVQKSLGLGLPVFVVDDGSTDSSFKKIKDIPNIKIIRHPFNKGKGAALLTGFIQAAKTADWAVTLDADGQHNPDDALNMIQAVSSHPSLIIGMRTGMSGTNVPWTSRFGRKFSNFWVWASGGLWLSDTQTGFRIYPLPQVLNLDVKARRFQFEVEVLAKAMWKKIPIIETPVSVNYHPGTKRISHFRPFRDFIRNSTTFTSLIFQRIFIPQSIRKKF